MDQPKFSHSSEIEAPIATVWRFATSPAGINHELMPILRVTVPRASRGVSLDEIEAGYYVGRCWMLLAGFLPVDYTKMTIAEIDPGTRFLERSTMGAIRQWQHERTFESLNPGRTRVTDSIKYELRLPLPGLASLAAHVIGLLFRHRHRRLARHFAP